MESSPKKQSKWAAFWADLPITKKLMLEILITAVALFISNLVIYAQINRMVGRMDAVYVSNVNLNVLSDALSNVQNHMYKYLEVRNSDSLTNYYRSEQQYRTLLGDLNETVTNHPIRILEKNIRNMSYGYLKLTDEAIQAKRSQNVERFQNAYKKASLRYRYINNEITSLNMEQFRNNSASYRTLQSALKYLETISLVMLVVVMMISIFVMVLMTKEVVTPLTNLAEAARLVGEGNFHVRVSEVPGKDELGIVTKTFNHMIASLSGYVQRVRESAEKEQEMKAKELLMQSNLKEAQLRFLQSQINPHFLFNSLNAGVQLAALENAEKTSVFLEKMADFFRYNVKKGMQDASIREEVETVENYIYILNVRFAGDIHFECRADKSLLNYRMPSMIMQPLVENAVNHGIRDLERQGEILLQVRDAGEEIEIVVEDNGKGMTEEQIQKILADSRPATDGPSTGVGLQNVITRLRLYYNQPEEVFRIISEGEDKGTKVILRLPKKEG